MTSLPQPFHGASPLATGPSQVEPVPVSPLRASVPNALEIETHLVRYPEDADYVVQMPERVRVEPEELWIAGLGVWLRCDGSYASADRARGGKGFSGDERLNLARAVAYWKTSFHAKAMEARQGRDGEAGSVHDSAVPSGDLPEEPRS